MLVQVLSLRMCAECTATVETLTRLTGDYPGMQIERLNIADRPEAGSRKPV